MAGCPSAKENRRENNENKSRHAAPRSALESLSLILELMSTGRWPGAMTSPKHVYEMRPRNDKRGFDLISDALPFGALWYARPNAISNAIG
jgi:hypothetical protein